ncbi:hypothetical protein [Hafnia psychrotolerans]|uniref:Transposase n=1 Tax=Hafnia psychrotolerans TaxID=1477018 RepID=A0ABQ1G1W5_9GAMM|nr:hypothetical protein [Hafnia psychrotolerans]GGA35815.1 hypothetical protein GCM10011328_08310 [Hafnia psychrotolerans]
MKKSRFTEEQIFFALKQVELGRTPPEMCHKLWQVRTLRFIFPGQRPKRLSGFDSVDATQI